jgi:hypothetical protein
VHALEEATVRRRPSELSYYSLPPVIPFATLQGESPPRNLVLPKTGQIIRELSPLALHQMAAGQKNSHYKIHPDGTWEDGFPVQLLPGALQIKLDGFRAHWEAKVARHESDRFLFHLELPSRSFWERQFGRPRRLEIEVIVASGLRTGVQLTEARIFLRVVSGEPVQMKGFLERMAGDLFESLRSFLQARREQRSDERRPFRRPLDVYPIRPGLELGEVLSGVGVDICSGGLGFRVPQRPETDWFYLHFPDVPAVSTFTLLGRFLRATPSNESGLRVAACLLGT